MGDVKNIKHCQECEHLGDGRFPVVEHFVGGELESRLVGYSDRPNGGVVENFARKCELKTKIIVYNESIACKDFKQKTWTRPNNCRDCTRKTLFFADGTFHCSGYPFFKFHRNADAACQNGKSDDKKQYTLFDFI